MASTYSPTLKRAVPSALAGLTSLFGKGRGGPCCYRHRNHKYLKFLIPYYRLQITDLCKILQSVICQFAIGMIYRMIEVVISGEVEFISLRVISITRL